MLDIMFMFLMMLLMPPDKATPPVVQGVVGEVQASQASAAPAEVSLEEAGWFVDNEADKSFDMQYPEEGSQFKWQTDDLGQGDETKQDDGLTTVATGATDQASPDDTQTDDGTESESEEEETDSEPSPAVRPRTDYGHSSGAAAFIQACQEELDDWNAGIAGHRRYEDPFEENGDGSGWCGMFIGYCAGKIGSGAVHWEADAFPGEPTTPMNYHDWYLNNPQAGTITDNDGTVMPKPGDLVLMWGGAHVEMVEAIDEDGTGWWGISGGGSVDHTHHSPDDGSSTWYITPNWTLLGYDS